MCQGPSGGSRDPLGAAGTLLAAEAIFRQQGLPGSINDPLKAAGIPWKQQGNFGTGRDPLEGTRNPWK